MVELRERPVSPSVIQNAVFDSDSEAYRVKVVEGDISVDEVSVSNFPSVYPLPDTQVDEDTYFTGYVWDSFNLVFVRIEGYINDAQYGYDANGNLISETLTIVDSFGNTLYTIKKTYAYDANGNLTGESKWVIQ